MSVAITGDELLAFFAQNNIVVESFECGEVGWYSLIKETLQGFVMFI